jgi:starch synthase
LQHSERQELLNILFAASEAAPFAKTGGLADTVSALPQALQRLGGSVSIIIPRYSCTLQHPFEQKLVIQKMAVPVSDRFEYADIYETEFPTGVKIYLIDQPRYYNRDGIYGINDKSFSDNAERYIFFCRAVAEFIHQGPTSYQILHANDWQTALIPLYAKYLKNTSERMSQVKTLFTIHNLAYQGVFWSYDMHLTGLPWDYYNSQGIEFYGSINLMKAGIIYADQLTTVSDTYLRDILEPEWGCSLDGLLRERRSKLHAIFNGIDTDDWNPETDQYIPAHFSVNDLSGKTTCKLRMLNDFNLNIKPDKPLVGMISRLIGQKGLDILSNSMPELMNRGIGLILLGTGESSYSSLFENHALQYKQQFVFLNCFDENLAHKIEAASDIYLMPSRYEPGGLNQLYSYRYGSIPVVRATGGLDDSVYDYDERTKQGTGFKFREYSPHDLVHAVDRAISLFQDHTNWKELILRNMNIDVSCAKAAKKYIDLYSLMLES